LDGLEVIRAYFSDLAGLPWRLSECAEAGSNSEELQGGFLRQFDEATDD
jgi:hypothetical protein